MTTFRVDGDSRKVSSLLERSYHLTVPINDLIAKRDDVFPAVRERDFDIIAFEVSNALGSWKHGYSRLLERRNLSWCSARTKCVPVRKQFRLMNRSPFQYQ